VNQETREAILDAGLRSFGERGYGRSRVVDIAEEAGFTTGAVYRHFEGKLALYEAIFERYAESLQAAIVTAPTMAGQFEAWLDVSAEYAGIVRATVEVVRPGTRAAAAAQRLRDIAATLLARFLPNHAWRDARAASLLLVDVLDQYVFAEVTGAVATRSHAEVAGTLAALVQRGLYRTAEA
jgi:AcrR family transcriptional regulator